MGPTTERTFAVMQDLIILGDVASFFDIFMSALELDVLP